jgi:hypothetical protein
MLYVYLTAESRLRFFENRVLRRIFTPERDEVTGEWRRLHNDILLTKHHSGDQVKRNEKGRTCSMYGEEERRIEGFGGKT